MRMLITGGLVARADGVFNTDILIEGDRILELNERLHEQQPEERKSWTCPAAWSCPAGRRPYPST
ncbi:MAG: hypothetical protein ACLSAH_19825 [Bilophila wadsworthia]